MPRSEFDGAEAGDQYVFRSFANEGVDLAADAQVSAWLNEMHQRGYEINTFQQENRWAFFVMEKAPSSV